MKDYYELSRKCPSGSFSYTIKAGDTLWQLARTYNTTVDAILAINPGINPNNLQVGQKICIPKDSKPPRRCPAGSFEYTIKQGDTLWQLARTYNTTVEAIMALNPGIDP
ncbi:MAG: LysM peptidoglycan-binding domain-containing protein, partial [Tissierellia bacterium]|nr:LysM peptidoglycan-binding domain-containing protein [Tissierellia bacterium]